MGYRNREKERKFLVSSNVSYDQAITLVKEVFPHCERIIDDCSRDYYWNLVEGLKGDFIRLRMMPDGSAQLTVKHADKGSNTNRVEVDVGIPLDQVDQVKAFLEYVHGPISGSVMKDYFVFFLAADDHTTVSIYQVIGDKRLFVEVEAKTIKKIDELVTQIEEKVSITPIKESLYQLFIRRSDG